MGIFEATGQPGPKASQRASTEGWPFSYARRMRLGIVRIDVLVALVGLISGCSSSSVNPAGTGGKGGAGGSSGGGCEGGNAGDHFNLAGGSCYRFVSSATSWDQAESACEAWQGHLATVSSDTEQKYVVDLMGEVNQSGQNIYYAWIGGKVDASKVLTWVNGDKVTYQTWASGQPSGQGCVKLDRTQSWNWWVEACDSTSPCFVCERPQ